MQPKIDLKLKNPESAVLLLEKKEVFVQIMDGSKPGCGVLTPMLPGAALADGTMLVLCYHSSSLPPA